jgi:glucose 1-dehydrogenase
MRQDAVAPRPPQRNELNQPTLSVGLFVHLGKGNDRVVAKYSIEGKRPATSPRLQSIPSQWCFRSERAFFGLDRNRLLFRTPNGTSSTVDRERGTIANDGDPGVSQLTARSSRRSSNSRPVCFVRNRTLSRRMCKTKKPMPAQASTYRPKPKMPHDHIFKDLPRPVVPKVENRELLKGQKAIVTGASSGIGRSIALALGHAGADVCVNYVAGEDKAQAMVDELRGHGHTAFAFRADVSNEEDVAAMFKTVCDEFGTVDILVNNAGLQQDAPVDQMTLAQWNKVISVNLTGQFLCAREAIREFKRRGVRPEISCCAGKIICVSSVHEIIPWAGHVNYAASKGGVMLMMKSIAQEVAPYRIRVNSIAPGAIRTPINMQAWDTPEHYNELLKLIPYKRIGEPEEIGRVAAWLASDESDYIQGATLFVDGGMTLYPGFETGG